MYQIGSISTPGTCTQGKLLQYVPGLDADQPIIPLPGRVVSQCGVPSILTEVDSGLYLFVAGQADHPSSPFCAPWPLSPLCLHYRAQSAAWDLIRLPDRVDGIQRFVSGIPSAVAHDRTVLVYFNGGQLLEYQRISESEWSVSAVPVPDVVVDANPVAAVAGGKVYVLAAPRGEGLLLCERELGIEEWRFRDLGAESAVHRFDGDPAVVEFAGKLHIFVSGAVIDPMTPMQEACELWDFQVKLDGTGVEACSVSAVAGFRQGALPVRVTGTPTAVVSHPTMQVFVRSGAGRLVEFRSADGERWESLPISQDTVGGNAGAVVSDNAGSLVYATDRMGYLTEFRESQGAWQERRISRTSGEVERWPRAVACARQVRVFDLDVAV
jgi:hypothetical protein